MIKSFFKRLFGIKPKQQIWVKEDMSSSLCYTDNTGKTVELHNLSARDVLEIMELASQNKEKACLIKN